MKKKTFLFLAAAAVLLAVSCNKANLEQTTPQTAEDYKTRGFEYLNNGDYDSAIEEFTQAIKLNPDDADAYINRGIVCSDNGDYYWAIANFTQAIRLDPNDAETYYNRGFAYSIIGDNDRATANYTQALRLDPYHFGANLQLGEADRTPQTARAFLERGNIFAERGDYDAAIADFTQAISLNPNFPNVDKANNSRRYAYSKGMCTVHNIPMSKGSIKIGYGLMIPPYIQLHGEYFPNSDDVWGGCEVSSDYPQYFEGYFCEACNTERDI